VIGGAGAGAWLVRPAIPGMRPTPVTRAFTVSARQPPLAEEPAEADPARPSITSSEPPAPVTLVPSRLSVGTVDAVLVPERDLDRFKRFALGQPLAEDSLLIPGDRCFLVTESAGLRSTLPLGLPLRRVGPGGLYLAHGYALSPPLPPTARASLFNVREGQFVAVCPHGTYRFVGENARWVWSLWLPPTPPRFAAGISARGRVILERTDTLQAGAPPPASAATGADPAERARLRRDAILLEQEGRTQRAAELLEEAGQYARAATLYERLARADEPAPSGETR
jgi:FtsH ternary system domain X7